MFAVSSSLLSAQAPTPAQAAQAAQQAQAVGEIRGRVVDAKSDAGVARASVSVRVKGSPTILSGAIAGNDGSFRVQNLRPGTYSLRITFIGFSPLLQEATITPASPVLNLGNVKISQVAVNLAAVAVNEERAAVSVEADRNAYRAKDVAPAAANASEVLEATPSVQVDQDGKVSLRGNENVAVQINGRPTPLRGAQLASYLKTLPANVLDRIEVVPNPSAKYDPDGMAGIINLVLKQNVDLGLSAGLNGAVSKADRFFTSGTLGYQSGPWSSFSSAGVNKDSRASVGINDRERYDALRSLLSATDQDVNGQMGYNGQNATTNVDYKLNARDVLSNALTVNHRSNSDLSQNAYSELAANGALTDRYVRPRDMDAHGWMIDYDLSLKRTLEPRKHELSGEVRFNRAHDEDQTSLWREPAAGITGNRIEGEIDATDAVTKQLTAQTDYMKMLASRTKLETGYKANVRWMDRDYSVLKDSLGTGNWTRGSTSNALSFDESVQAAYAVVSQGYKKLDLQGGLRAEHAERTFALTGDKSYPFTYNSLFPSAVASFNYSDFTQYKASYSRRVRRPGTQELNPFPSYFDVQTALIGNPALGPEYTDSYELSGMKNMSKGMVQLSPFYRHTSNVIRVDINTLDHLDGREVTTVSFRNLHTSNSWGTDLNGSLRLGPKFNGFGGVNVFKMVTDGGSSSVAGSDAVTWSARVNGSSDLTSTISLQASYFYRAPMKIERGEFRAVQFANFVVKKKIDGDKASVTLRVTDPFNTNVFRIRAGNDEVAQITERNFGARQVFLGFNYSYGRPPRIRQVPQDQQQQGSSGFAPPA